MSSTATRAIDVAARIGEYLRRTAIEHEGRCNWMGTAQDIDEDGESYEFRYETLEPDVYGGTGGVALFLTELYRHTGDQALRSVTEGAISQSIARLTRLDRLHRFGFYSGVTGIAYASARAGVVLGRDDLMSRARDLLLDLTSDVEDEHLLDVISGAASAIPVLLDLSAALGEPELVDRAMSLGDRILHTAHRATEGWSWGDGATGFESERDLTGFAHGAAGMGWSLFELHEATGEVRFLEGAREAFRYESHWFLPSRDNWPDFRSDDGSEEPIPCAVAWCHGSPGIGLSRIRALSRPDAEAYRRDAAAAIRSAVRALSTDRTVSRDFSLCHGTAGVVECMLAGARVLGDEEAIALATDIAARAAERYAADPATWPCAVRRGNTPALMTGLSGIGYFYLRLADPETPSVLLPGNRVSIAQRDR